MKAYEKGQRLTNKLVQGAIDIIHPPSLSHSPLQAASRNTSSTADIHPESLKGLLLPIESEREVTD